MEGEKRRTGKGEQDGWEKRKTAATFLTRSFVIVSRTFPLRFLIWEEIKSLFTGFGGEEA